MLLLGMLGCSVASQRRNVEGVRYYQTGRYYDAISSFQRALSVNPDDADAYYNLAATYYALGKANRDANVLAQAEGLYHQCLDIDPQHTECYRGLAALLVETNRSESAFTLLKGWSVADPESPEPRIELARLYEEFGNRDAAAQYLTDALHLDSYNPRAWTALGRIREQRGEYAQALANYQQAYQLNHLQPGLGERIATVQRNLITGGTPPIQR